MHLQNILMSLTSSYLNAPSNFSSLDVILKISNENFEPESNPNTIALNLKPSSI